MPSPFDEAFRSRPSSAAETRPRVAPGNRESVFPSRAWQIAAVSIGFSAAAVFFAAPTPVAAGYGCPGYFSHLPTVWRLAERPDGIVVALETDRGNDQWQSTPEACGKNLSKDLPPLDLTEVGRLRSDLADRKSTESLGQEAVECRVVSGRTYFGFAFYEGEGFSGVGGLGRFDPAAGRFEIRRPASMRKLSVGAMVFDGARFWIALARQGEGFEFPGGLWRYDWPADRLEPMNTEESGPCGYWINDLLVAGNAVWVATDLGVSAFDLTKSTWRHFIPDSSGTGRLLPDDCGSLYRRLLTTLPALPNKVDGACPLLPSEGDPYTDRSLFRAYLRSFRPKTLSEIERTLPRRPADEQRQAGEKR